MKQNKLVQIIKLRFCSMIRSMTGYGRAEALVDGRNILVETVRSITGILSFPAGFPEHTVFWKAD